MSRTSPKLLSEGAKIGDLLLDPNNPRFVDRLQGLERVPDADAAMVQAALLKRFQDDRTADENSEDEPFFDISDLTESMKQIGFVPIDRVVVRKLEGSDNYIVIEGNRRVSAAKTLLLNDEKQTNSRLKLTEPVRVSLEKLSVLVLDTEGLGTEELDRQIGVILGLRHFGQVLQWDALPRAVNIFKTYMDAAPKVGRVDALPKLGSFRWQRKRAWPAPLLTWTLDKGRCPRRIQ